MFMLFNATSCNLNYAKKEEQIKFYIEEGKSITSTDELFDEHPSSAAVRKVCKLLLDI